MSYFTDIKNHPELNIYGNENILKVVHNAGFFSCCSIALFNIIGYFNHFKYIKNVDRTEQFSLYKKNPQENLIPLYFQDNDINIEYVKDILLFPYDSEPQFSNYKDLNIKDIIPFIDSFFKPSNKVLDILKMFEDKYKLDYDNLCSIFYRGNDKSRETAIASYENFLSKAEEIKKINPNIRFLIQPDETEFLEEFLKKYPDSIYFEETPHMNKKDSCMFYEIDINNRAEYACYFFAAVLASSKCKHLVTHSGNGGFWAVLYRKNIDNMYQILNNKWL